MSQEMWRENVEAVYRVYDALHRRDLEAFVSDMHSEVEGTSYVLFEGQTFRGHEGMREFVHELTTVIDWNGEVLEATPYGKSIVIATIKHSATSAGVLVTQTAYQAVRFKDGKAIWWGGYSSPEDALRSRGAVGPAVLI